MKCAFHVALLTMLLLPARVVAEEATDAPEASDAAEASGAESQAAAQEHTARAQEHYTAGRYEEALREYTAAYELFPHPFFLFNLGQCHRELGNHERTIHFFVQYLREQPDAPNRDVVERLLAAARLVLEEESPDAGLGDAGPGDAGPEATDAGPEEVDAGGGEVDGGVVVRTPIYRRWWFWTIIGVVVAGAVTGGAVGAAVNDNGDGPPTGSAGTVDWR